MEQALTTGRERFSHVQLYTQYKSWADGITYSVAMNLSPQELTKERKSFFGSILATLNHTYIVDDIFRCHLQGVPHGYASRKPTDQILIEELWSKVQVMNALYEEMATNLTDDEKMEIVSFNFVDSGNAAMTREQIFMHVMNHATYHRGHVHDMFYQVPVTPPASDFTVFMK